jgi:hypothetical protein
LWFKASPGKIVHEILSRKNPSQKRASRVAEGVGPEFKPQYCKKKIVQNQRTGRQNRFCLGGWCQWKGEEVTKGHGRVNTVQIL